MSALVYLEISSTEQLYLFLFLFFFIFFETGSLYISLAVRELTLYTRLASHSEISLPLPPYSWDEVCATAQPCLLLLSSAPLQCSATRYEEARFCQNVASLVPCGNLAASTVRVFLHTVPFWVPTSAAMELCSELEPRASNS